MHKYLCFPKSIMIYVNLDSQLYNTREVYVGITNQEGKELHVKASNCLCTFLSVPGCTSCLIVDTSFSPITKVLSLSVFSNEKLENTTSRLSEGTRFFF